MNPEMFYSSMKDTSTPAPPAPAAVPATQTQAAAEANAQANAPGKSIESIAAAMFPSMKPAPPDPAAAPGTTAAPSTTAAPEGVPEAYQPFSAPEGIVIAPADLEAFTPIARELGLDQAKAQKLITLHAEREAANHLATVKAWESATMADPENGNASTIFVARGVVHDYGTPALRDALNQTGLGNHPELVRLLARVGAALARR